MESPVTTPHKRKSAIAILGGTFDPVHHGHLRLAIDLAEKLDLEQVRLMPSFQPVHRDEPTATEKQRLTMLQLAVEDIKELSVDDRELQRKGPSYTLLSLQEIRKEIGPDQPLFFILGDDAFDQFDSWYQWQEIINYAHLLIAIRPGSHPQVGEQQTSQQLEDFIQDNAYKGDGYPDTNCGSVIRMNNPILDIASSEIRKRVGENKNIRYLLPAKVYEYIEQQKIYR